MRHFILFCSGSEAGRHLRGRFSDKIDTDKYEGIMSHPKKMLLLGLLFIPVLGLVVMLLWNATLPAALGIASITFMQAVGILLLARILFGGLGGLGHRLFHHDFALHNRWRDLKPEEREAFLHRRHGHGHHHTFHREHHCKNCACPKHWCQTFREHPEGVPADGPDHGPDCERCVCPRQYCERSGKHTPATGS